MAHSLLSVESQLFLSFARITSKKLEFKWGHEGPFPSYIAMLFAGSLQSLFHFRVSTFSFSYILLSFKMNASLSKKTDIFKNIPQLANVQHFLEKDLTASTKVKKIWHIFP